MQLLKKVLKWTGVALLAVALAGVLFCWLFLGVNVFEGRVNHLWEVVSNEVHFFARWEGTRVMEESLPRALRNLPERDGYAFLLDARLALDDVTKQVAREVDPQLPLGLQVDFEKDFLGREMAIAGTVQPAGDLRVQNFIAFTRIARYARFVSALKADFVRSKLPAPWPSHIELVKGYYFRIVVPPQLAADLKPVEDWLGRPVKELYFGRVKDVLMVSDRPEWVEDAIRGGRETLAADPWFEKEFIEGARGRRDIEMFMRPHLAARLLQVYGRDDIGGPLFPVVQFLPPVMTGEVTVRAEPRPAGVEFSLTNNPPPEGFRKITDRHLINLYQYEKADLAHEMGENGIGRFIPKGAVGALLLRAKPDDLIDLFMEFIPRARLELFNEQVRETPGPTGRRYEDLASALREIMKDFGDMHMIVVHRPAIFQGRDYASFLREFDVPPAGLMYTLVSRIQDHVAGDQIRTRVGQHLRVLQLNPLGADPGGKFYWSEPVDAKDEDDLKLIRPAFGGMVGNMKYFVFSSNPEGAAAVMQAGEDPQARMIADPEVRAALGELPPEGTLAVVLRGEMVRRALWDQVRRMADESFHIPTRRGEWADRHRRPGMSDAELIPLVQEEQDRFIAMNYPDFRDRWERQIAWLGRIDSAVMAATLGEGPVKGARAQAYVHFRLPQSPPAEPGRRE